MTSLNFEVRYVCIDHIEIQYIAKQILAIQARGDIQRVMAGLKVLQPKLTGSVGLRDREAHETAVVRTVRWLAVNEMCSRDRLRRQSVNHPARSTVHFRTLA